VQDCDALALGYGGDEQVGEADGADQPGAAQD
jgi:hypothetical protein